LDWQDFSMTTDSPRSSGPDGPDAVQRFGALFEQHARAIYGHIRGLVPNVVDADEVFQETSLILWQKFDQYRPDTDFRAWACRIAYYKALNLRDRQYRSPRLFSPQFLDLVSEEMVVMSDVLDARTEALLQCRDKLSRRDRDLLDRFHCEGTTAKDVARWAGRNVHYVYRAIRRIHDALFDCIQRALSRTEKGTGPIGAKHPSDRSGQLDPSPFPRSVEDREP
jgi:RNA polymerase sigma-70 factor, ECF subfamily